LGTTTSKISNLLSSHPLQRVGGTSQRITSPSKKMHAEGNNLPSCSNRPSVEMDLTCTGGGISPASMFVNCDHFWFLSTLVVCNALDGAFEQRSMDDSICARQESTARRRVARNSRTGVPRAVSTVHDDSIRWPGLLLQMCAVSFPYPLLRYRPSHSQRKPLHL
jgi:hypothetical protein